jgi:hypothetical protein
MHGAYVSIPKAQKIQRYSGVCVEPIKPATIIRTSSPIIPNVSPLSTPATEARSYRSSGVVRSQSM